MNQYRALFRNRNFVLHWMASAISNVGDFFNSLALVKILSEDPERLGLYLALILIAKVLPGVVLGPVAGVVADRLPRRTIMVVSDLIRAVLVLGLVLVEQPALIITLVTLSAAAAVFFNPASNALLPSLVAREELVTASSLSVITQRLAMLVGNGIGAAVLMYVGPHNVFYIDSASFVLSAMIIGAMRLPVSANARTASAPAGEISPRVETSQPEDSQVARRQNHWHKFRDDLKEALAFVRSAATVRHLLITFAIVAVGDSALNVLLVTFFTVALGLAAENLGFVWALFAGTSLMGALAIGALGSRVQWRHLVAFGAVYVWATMVGMLLTHSVVPSVAFLSLLGVGSGAINVGVQAAVGELVPDQVRGRIFGAWGMIQSLIYIIGVLVAGALSDRLGPVAVLLGFTTFYLVAGVYAFIAFRARACGGEARAESVGD